MLRNLLMALRAQFVTLSCLSLIIVFLWWLAVKTGIADPGIFPPISDILEASTTLNDGTTATFVDHLLVTSYRVVVSLIAGTLLGLGIGMWFWRAPRLGRILEPYVLAFYAVPLVVFYPFLIVMFGITSVPIILISAAMCAGPIALNTWIGFRDQKRIHKVLALSLDMPRLLRFRRVEVPAALPQIFTGLRVGAVYGLVGTIGMEYMVSAQGLGYATRFQYETFNIPSMYLFIGATLVMSFVVVTALYATSAVLFRYDS